MRRKLNGGQYSRERRRHFELDLRLIFQNCRAFNYLPGNEYAKMADRMEARSVELLQSLQNTARLTPGFTDLVTKGRPQHLKR